MNNPPLIATPFAENGDKNTIPESVPLKPQNATLEAGFPPITQQKISEGGIPPERLDFNGALNLITQHTVFLNKGGRYGFDAEFAAKIGGYQKGAHLTLDDGTQVVSEIDANTNDPNTNMAGWVFPPIKAKASDILDESGLSQQQINYNGGSKWHSRVGDYQENERVVLANGDIVKSTIDGNANNPNVDMTGWEYDPVNLKLNTIANSIKRTLTEVVYDQLIDVTWFGAVGNWNKDTQTGHNSTVAVQNAITYLATLGTRRQGGKRGLKFPKGSFRVDNIVLPASLGFGIDIIGDGLKTTHLYFDHTSLNPAIDCEIEFVQLRNISLIGSLDETWVQARTPCYKARLPDGRADIDVTFFNCSFSYWNTVAQIHGRGCVFESCGLGLVVYGMDIVVEDYSHGDDTDLMQSKFATMRHYNYRNCRFDNCSRAYKVSGSGDMIDFINSGMFIGNDITNMDRLIEAPNAQLVNWCFALNVALGSFATSVVEVKALHMTGVMGNTFTKSTNYNVPPNTNVNSTKYFFDLTAPCTNLTVYGNTVRGIRGAFYRNTATSPSKNISIYGNNFPEFGSWKGGNTTINFMFANANHLNLLLKDNSFSCSNIAGSYYLFNFSNIQQAKDIIFKDNTAPFTWADRIFSHTPTVYVGGVATTGTSDLKLHQYVTDGDYVHGHFYFSGTLPELSGNISISLPVPAITLMSTFGTIPSGIAKIITATGVVSDGFMLADALVSSASQRIELRKQKDTTLSKITAADVPDNLAMCLEYKYRFK